MIIYLLLCLYTIKLKTSLKYKKLLKGYYHIFGHTQLKFNLSTSELSCLDCRVPFSLDSETGYINKLMDIPSE